MRWSEKSCDAHKKPGLPFVAISRGWSLIGKVVLVAHADADVAYVLNIGVVTIIKVFSISAL